MTAPNQTLTIEITGPEVAEWLNRAVVRDAVEELLPADVRLLEWRLEPLMASTLSLRVAVETEAVR